MKGTVLVCLQELVVRSSSEQVWQECLAAAGFERFHIFTPLEDVDEELIAALLVEVRRALNLTPEEAGEAFGAHWVGVYSQRIYRTFYSRAHTAREFFEQINAMHERVTRQIPNAKPPRFRLEWVSPTTLRMHYESSRGLIDIAAGMARAIGDHYKTPLRVTKRSSVAIDVTFPAG